MRLFISSILLVFAGTSAAAGQEPGNLLRNAHFQDDWLTLLPEMKNHHWNYCSEFYNRRDFNPDAWECKGAWTWLNAEKPTGQRRLLLTGPAELTQSVNWVAIHDDRKLSGFPDAGGFPTLQAVRSLRAETLLRDLELRVRLTGKDVPADAGLIELAWQPGPAATAPIPVGSYVNKVLEVKLSAAAFLEAVRERAAKNPKEAAEIAKSGIELPTFIKVTLRYKGKSGSVEVLHAEVHSAAPLSTGPLLFDEGFERLDKDGYPSGWSPPVKYRYFPPGHYYIFNTWHNSRSPNRGLATADTIAQEGRHSLRMTVPSGDEMAVLSGPIVLNQQESRLIEVQAMIKTDLLTMLQIDAYTDAGQRLDGFNFIHKAPVSVGSDGWRQVRQVFRPRTPVKSLRLALCARGSNGYTLDDTSYQPQANVVGTIWWDSVRLSEPESTTPELQKRGVVVASKKAMGASGATPRIVDVDMGERLLGDNVLRARIHAAASTNLSLDWEVTAPSGKKSSFRSKPRLVKGGAIATIDIPYVLSEPCVAAYTEYRGRLSLLDGKQKPVAALALWFATWNTPIDIDLGALYLRPEQKQFVRLNFGFAQPRMQQLTTVRLDVMRRGTGETLKTVTLDAGPTAFAAQRSKIPLDLRDDYANLLLTDLDLSFLPVQPFADPQRNWRLRVTALDGAGKELEKVESQPFCRLPAEPAQPPIQAVAIKGDMLYVNGQPWLPWGVTYGHNPVYAGPADPGKYRDLANLPPWGIYDRHSGALNSRKQFDFNTLRYVAGSITASKVLDKNWQEDNLYCSTAFPVPDPVFSTEELFKKAGGKDKLDAYLAWCRKSPMVVSVTPGVEEAFGLFHQATPQQIEGMKQAADYLRKESGRPVMVSHGGYWNRFEFERAPFFDIFDPETEPLYPANLHTDLRPLVAGKDKVIWLRPQMYESVPYERWRFHVFVEMMRGSRGWQVAHGMGDTSLMRGLHGEVEHFKPILASAEAGAKVDVTPWLEHWSRGYKGKTYIMAATTRGIAFGKWETTSESPPGGKVSRLTIGKDELRDESNAYAVGGKVESGPATHGLQYLPDARSWPKGSKIVQWVKLDAKATPKNLVMLAKVDGRWTHAAAWGKVDLTPLRKNPETAYWFLNVFYRHAKGFLGWGRDLLPQAMEYIPDKAIDFGNVPAAGESVKLEVPLERIGAADKLLDGLGFMHEDGRAWWGHTSIVAPNGDEKLVWGDSIELPPASLAKVKVQVAGLKKGTKVRVLFEDRDIVADDGYFTDDFRGHDLYQRYGGGFGAGYGDAPVALHLYEVGAK